MPIAYRMTLGSRGEPFGWHSVEVFHRHPIRFDRVGCCSALHGGLSWKKFQWNRPPFRQAIFVLLSSMPMMMCFSSPCQYYTVEILNIMYQRAHRTTSKVPHSKSHSFAREDELPSWSKYCGYYFGMNRGLLLRCQFRQHRRLADAHATNSRKVEEALCGKCSKLGTR